MTQTTTRTAPRSWDFGLTAVFVLSMIILAVVGMVIAVGMSVSAVLCAEGKSCSYDLVQWGTSITAFGPAVLALIFTVVCIVRVVRRKISFGFGALGTAMAIGVIMLGVMLVDAGLAGL